MYYIRTALTLVDACRMRSLRIAAGRLQKPQLASLSVGQKLLTVPLIQNPVSLLAVPLWLVGPWLSTTVAKLH